MPLWQECNLEVKAELVPRYFWTTASINVYVDDVCIIQTGGVWRLRGIQRAGFRRNNENQVLELAWQSSSQGVDFF